MHHNQVSSIMSISTDDLFSIIGANMHALSLCSSIATIPGSASEPLTALLTRADVSLVSSAARGWDLQPIDWGHVGFLNWYGPGLAG